VWCALGVRRGARLGRPGRVAPVPVPAGSGARRRRPWGTLLPPSSSPDDTCLCGGGDGFYITQFQVTQADPLI
jgi:hypothetical protein